MPKLAANDVPEIVVLSGRADLVSGGDALVEIRLPDGLEPSQIRVVLNGRDVSGVFAVRPNGRFQGLVSGLRDGANELTAMVSGNIGATLAITNHRRGGPLIAGPHVQPYVFETEEFGLEPATGPQGWAPARYDFFYKSAVTGRFETYDLDSPPPEAEVAQTTTDQNKTVPYIVRRERGTLNRGVYDIAVLYQPGEEWEPWAPQDGWNGKLLMLFQGAVKPWHRQAGAISLGMPDVLDYMLVGDLPLAHGFAVAASSLGQANGVLSAETAIMLKELFIKTYGPVRYTMGFGGSGGAMMQHHIANNYPGVLDGIMPAHSLPDMWTILANDAMDYSLLHHYFTQTSPHLWADPAERAAVDGTKQGQLCEVWGTKDRQGLGSGVLLLDPRVGCTADTAEAEPDWVYDSENNPEGPRGTLQDWQAVVFGHRAADGFANRPLDNVGVQYGLVALLQGKITPEQFVDLNAKIGGRDIDYHHTPERSEADREGLRNVYRSGLVNDCSNLDRVPIMDLRLNATNDYDIHATVHTQITRARLIAANGHGDNQVRWVTPDPLAFEADEAGEPVMAGGDSAHAMAAAALVLLDRWLASIDADDADDPLEVKVLRHKPAEAVDTCWVDGKPGDGDSVANYWLPRMVAGGPLASDVFKCQLKPIDWDDYGPVEFTGAQKDRLRAAFPQGVCDWTKPGVEQQTAAGVWQTFADTIGGRPLGPEPRSTPGLGGYGSVSGEVVESSTSDATVAIAPPQSTQSPKPAGRRKKDAKDVRVPFA